MSIPLVSVIGAVEDELMSEFVAHYTKIGVTDFFVGFHFPDHVTDQERSRTLETWQRLVGPPTIVSTGPWHEHLHGELRDRLRCEAGEGWHLIADSDEFHGYPHPLPDVVAAAEDSRHRIVKGVLLDRVSNNGALGMQNSELGLDTRYPLAGFITAELTGGDPRKIVLAKSGVQLGLGSHYSPTDTVEDTCPVPVHHFKWRPPVLSDLRRRVEMHSKGAWSEVTSAIRDEAARFLDHLGAHDGILNMQELGIQLRPASVDAVPAWWEAESRQYLAARKPAVMKP